MRYDELYSRSWCDLIFSGRNQEYGAYQLRRSTGHRHAIALAIVFIVAAFCALPIALAVFLHRPAPPLPNDFIHKITRFEGVRLKEARPHRLPPRPASVEPAADATREIEQATLRQEQRDIVFHPEDETIDAVVQETTPPDSAQALIDETHLEVAQAGQQTDGQIVDSIPAYPGGIRAFMRWLDSELVYPPECIRRRIQGTVEVAFIVEADGQTSDLRLVTRAHPTLDHEAMRAMRKMPAWRPAQKNNQPIRAQVTVPIVFELSQ